MFRSSFKYSVQELSELEWENKGMRVRVRGRAEDNVREWGQECCERKSRK